MTQAQHNNGTSLSLCWGSMEGIPLQEFVVTAAAAGFDHVTFSPAQYLEAKHAGLADADIGALLRNNGLTVSNVDPLFNWLPGAVTLDGNDPIALCTQASLQEVFHIAHVVGAGIVNAPMGFAIADSQQQIVDSFGQLCGAAAQEELRVSLEFMPFTEVSDLSMAQRIVQDAACDNGGIMFDCWHHHRAGGSACDILAVPGDYFVALQLDDALLQPMEDIIEETLNHRCLPGSGCIDLVQIMRNLDAIGADVVCDVEVFDVSLRELPALERAQRMYASAKCILQRARQ